MSYLPHEQYNFYNFRRSKRPYYISIADLYNWAVTITSETEEGDDYHDSLTMWEDMIGNLTSLFNGSQTYVDPITGNEVNLIPLLYNEDDMQDYIFSDYNERLVWWPLFAHYYQFTTDEATINERFYMVLTHFCNKVNRFAMANWVAIYKSLGILSIQYNPIADYWRKGVDLSAAAPYVTLSEPGTGSEEPTISGWNSDSSHSSGYHSEQKAMTGANQPKVESYTSTYDDASTGRLAGYQQSQGGNETTTTMPNSGVVKKYKEEGNKGTFSPQEMIEKELELNSQLGNLLRNFLDKLMNEVCLSVIYGD